MTVTLTTNLGLRKDSSLTADAKYNLDVIDTLGGKITIAVGGATKLRASGNIVIEPDCTDSGVGGSGAGIGNLTLGAASNKIATLTVYATTIDFQGTAPTSLGLASKNVLIGSAGGVATATDTNALGDIEATTTGGLAYKALSVTGADIANSTITYGKLALSGDIVTADVSNSDAIAWS